LCIHTAFILSAPQPKQSKTPQNTPEPARTLHNPADLITQLFVLLLSLYVIINFFFLWYSLKSGINTPLQVCTVLASSSWLWNVLTSSGSYAQASTSWQKSTQED